MTNREAYLVEEKTSIKNTSGPYKYEYITEYNETSTQKISFIKNESETNNIDDNKYNNLESIKDAQTSVQIKSFCDKSEIESIDNKDNLRYFIRENENKKIYSEKNKINPKSLIKAYIGHVSEAHHYILDNEFILKGYRINFHSCKKISSSLCMCHNETINVWTHFIGAILIILFMFLVIFNIGPINPESFLKEYLKKRSQRNNYSHNDIDRSFFRFQINNQTNGNSSRIHFEIRNNSSHDFNVNLKSNDSNANISNNTINGRRMMDISSNESIFGLINTISKLKLLNNLELESLANNEISCKNEKREEDKENKFIENYLNIFVKEDKDKNIKRENIRNFIDIELFQQINSFLNIDNLIKYLQSNVIDDYFLIAFKNITKIYIDDFNKIFISSVNKIIEKYNEITDRILNKKINILKDSVKLKLLNSFLIKVIK